MKKLFAARTTDGQSAAHQHSGGKLHLFGQGTFGSGTITVQACTDKTSGSEVYVPTAATLTADGHVSVDLPPCFVRLDLTGSTAANVNAWVASHHA